MFCRTVLPGVEIRQFRIEDAEPVFAAVDRHRAYLREWLPWVDHTHTSADVAEFISRTHQQLAEGKGPQAVICVEGAISGSLGCHPIDWENRATSIGYWIDPQLQGRGIVTRASTVMLDYLFKELDLHRVEIRCGTGNTRSCAIPERLGFVCEGVAREAQWVGRRWVDLVVWSMLAREWAQGRATRT